MNSRLRQVGAITVAIWLASIAAFGLGLAITKGGAPEVWMLCWLVLLPAAGIPLSALLYAVMTRLENRTLWARWRWLVPLIALIILAQAAYDHTLYGLLPGLFGLETRAFPFVTGVAFNAVLYFWLLVLYAIVLELLIASDRAARHAVQAANALEAARSAQLEALRTQLSPHMLFNTFNNLSSLVLQGRNAQAETMLARLSEFMRACLDGSEAILAPIEEELSLVESFVAIEAVRFATPPALTLDLGPGLEEAEVPRLILQPLIENAMKYAVHPSNGQAEIAVTAAREGERLRLVVTDTGCAEPPATVAAGTGRGLSIVRRRLETLYGSPASLTAGPNERGFRVEILLPLRPEGGQRLAAAVIDRPLLG